MLEQRLSRQSNSIKTRLAGVVLLMLLGCIWLMTLAITRNLERDIARLIEAQNNAAAASIAAEVDGKLGQHLDLIGETAALLGRHADAMAQLHAVAGHHAGISHLFSAGIFLVDDRGDARRLGNPRAPATGGRLPPEIVDLVRNVREHGKAAVGKAMPGADGGPPVLPFGAPVVGPNGERARVLVGLAALSGTGLFGPIQRGTAGYAGSVLVSDARFGVVVSSTWPDEVMKPYPASESLFDDAIAGIERARLARHPDGREVLVSTRMVPDQGWSVQVVLPVAEAFQPIRHMRRMVYAVAGGLTLLSLVGVWLFLGRLLRPLDEVTAAVRRMAGDPAGGTALPIAGPREVCELAESFNALAEQRMRSTEALRRSEDRLSRAELISKTGNWEVDLGSMVVTASIGARNIYGVTEAQTPLATLQRQSLPEYREMLDAAFAALVQQGLPYDVRFKIVAADIGEVKDVRALAFRDYDKGIVFGVVSDVTERRIFLEVLEQEEQRRRLFLDKASEGVAVVAADGRLVEWNPAFAKMLGYSETEIGWLSVFDWDARFSRHDLETLLASDMDNQTIESRHRRKDGSEYDVEISISRVTWSDQSFSFCLCRDISARKQADLALRESEARFRAVIQSSPVSYLLCGENADVAYVNDAFVKTFGYAREDLGSVADWWCKACPDDAYRAEVDEKWQAHVDAVRRGAHPVDPVEIDIRCKNGERRLALVSAEPVRGVSHGAHIISLVDISARQQAEEAQRLAATVFAVAREGIMITDADGNILDVNQAFGDLTGYTREEVLGRNPRLLGSGRHSRAFYAGMWRDLERKGHWSGEVWNRRKDGSIFPEMLTISVVRDRDGKTQQYVALFSDITEIKEQQQKLERMAHYDPLCGLPNRTLLSDRLHQAMVQAQRRAQRIAVCYLDLDGFKQVNDRYGHAIGDQLLVALSGQMKQTLRESDTLARIGGDEFVAVLMDLPDEKAALPTIERLIRAVAQPTHVGGFELQVSVSLGVTFYPQHRPVDADQLLREADNAMYQAKTGGKNRYVIAQVEAVG
ncbi:PAS domain S-box protein [Propionivibrio dicarboxylicus]|uniref:PAS domain S-box-containing protein/diguanylate cyclase (GGDEF) domain-containing protein n=1 Tax=Propionivibrio dicarboxylicus TaxID=83767 RepID=A0A1G7ZA84_9RHOO|nr:PAS domain S-box protein [Propionivibrio dicarboxylicus]SDH05653.1 PAS domain S-box-containing protein/diguanylate cyclase (GGDEF) domain-containing protein [Propionivibrio dicarboxylicus]